MNTIDENITGSEYLRQENQPAANVVTGPNQQRAGIAVIVATLAFFGLFAIYADYGQRPSDSDKFSLAVGVNLKEPVFNGITNSAFHGIELEAESAAVFDLRSGKFLYERNVGAQLPLASLTKIMTAVVAKEAIPNPTIVTIEKDDIAKDGDSGLKIGEEWNLYDLIKFTLISSSNDGASALATAIGAVMEGLAKPETEIEIAFSKQSFVEKMNKKAKELKLEQTFFINESGLDETKGFSGAYGSARDVAKLLAYAVTKHPDIMSATSEIEPIFVTSNNENHTAKNTNPNAAALPGILGSKTGFTDLAGGNLAIALDISFGRPIIIVVLGSNEEGRFKDVGMLADAAFANFYYNEI